ncbi:MAG: diguanylate cyclase [Dehalococcoidia bacterium]
MAREPITAIQPAANDILDSIDRAVLAVDADLKVAYANPTLATLLRSLCGTDGLLVGRPLEQVLDGLQAHGLLERVRAVATGLHARYCGQFPARDRILEFDCTPVGGMGTGAVLVFEDVSEAVQTRSRLEGLRRVSRSLARADGPAEAVAALIAEASMLTGAQMGAIYTLDDHDQLRAVDGWGIDPATLTAIERFDEQNSSLAVWAIRSREPVALPDLSAIPGIDHGLAAAANIHAAIAVPLLAAGRPRGVLVLAFNQPAAPFTADQLATVEALGDELATTFQRAELVDRLAREALTDPVTGLANRRAFEDALVRHHSRAIRLSQPYGLLMADVDTMKSINDARGHAAGDAALRLVGRTLIVATRAADLVARVGGDEFAVLLPEANPDGVALVLDRLRRSMPIELPWKGNPITLRISAGGASFPGDGQTTDQILQHADEALYRAKRRIQKRQGNGTN